MENSSGKIIESDRRIAGSVYCHYKKWFVHYKQELEKKKTENNWPVEQALKQAIFVPGSWTKDHLVPFHPDQTIKTTLQTAGEIFIKIIYSDNGEPDPAFIYLSDEGNRRMLLDSQRLLPDRRTIFFFEGMNNEIIRMQIKKD